MANQRDIEQLLRRIPLASQSDESNASDMLQVFISLRNAAFEGSGTEIPGTTTAFSIPSLIRNLKEGNYVDVAITLISVAGDAAGAYGFLIPAAVEAGALAETTAIQTSLVVSGMIGEIAGPAALAAGVLVETFRIPSSVNENNSKLYFLTDASGILTSWMFNMPEVNPHARLTQESRTGGYLRADLSDQCRAAHDNVQRVWRSNYQGNAEAQRQAKLAAHDSWEEYWLDLGRALTQRLSPFPTGVGRLWVQGAISEAKRSMRRAESNRAMQRFQARQRRAAGGFWMRTSEGIELFVPDR